MIYPVIYGRHDLSSVKKSGIRDISDRSSEVNMDEIYNIYGGDSEKVHPHDFFNVMMNQKRITESSHLLMAWF